MSRARKWLSMKKTAPHGDPRRDIRCSIAMASTAKPPDPMPCALAVILLPESRAPVCHTRKTLFPGQASHTCDGVCSWSVPARGVRSCGMRRLREPGQRHGCGGSVPGVAGGRRPLEGSYSRPGARAGTVCGWACRGLGDAVRSGGAGLSVRGRLGSCGVRWLFQGCCSGRRVGHWATIAWREGGFRKCS
jgi:hypothetical protein